MGQMINRRRVMGGHDEIIMTSTSNPEVLAICYAQGWCADANYMTKAEAEVVANIGTAFYQNSSISHFNEFVYFTGITSLPNNAFQKCSSLASITLPPSLRYVNGRYCFTSCTNLSFLELPEGVLEVNGPQWIYATSITRLIIPSTVISGSNYLMTINSNGRDAKCTAICKAVTPPTLSSAPPYTASINAVYVPDNSVDAYKADANWGTIADKIKPMSELPT